MNRSCAVLASRWQQLLGAALVAFCGRPLVVRALAAPLELGVARDLVEHEGVVVGAVLAQIRGPQFVPSPSIQGAKSSWAGSTPPLRRRRIMM